MRSRPSRVLAFLFNRLGGVVRVGVGVGEVAAGVAGGDVREASSVALAAGDHETGVRIAHLAFRVAAGAEQMSAHLVWTRASGPLHLQSSWSPSEGDHRSWHIRQRRVRFLLV